VLNIYIEQFFGDGGTPSVTVSTLVTSETLTATWVKYDAEIVVPSTSGKTLGTNNNDLFVLRFDLPTNTISHIAFTNIQIEKGDKVSPYETETVYETARRSRAFWLPEITDEVVGRVLTVIRGQNPYLLPNNPMLAWSGGFCPTGSIMEWPGEVVPEGWWECNGMGILRYLYEPLYKIFTNNYTVNPLWGANINSSFGDYVAQAGATIYITTLINGNVTDASDIDTGFTITVTQQGSATQPEHTSITCLDAISISAGARFYIHTPGIAYVVWYRKDKEGNEPTDVGYTPLRVDILDTDNADTVATKTLRVLYFTEIYIPYFPGYFTRAWNHGSANDPDAGTRTARNPYGATADHVGSYQVDEFKSHTHNLPYYLFTEPLTGSAGVGEAELNFVSSGITEATGGAETRPKNVYVMKIIKY
jgi:hypothetical protein